MQSRSLMGDSFLGRAGTFGGSTGAEAALHFSLDVAAQGFRDDAGGGEFAKVGDGELREVRKNGGQRRGGLAQKRDPNVVGNGPFAMMNNRGNHGSGKFLARKSS